MMPDPSSIGSNGGSTDVGDVAGSHGVAIGQDSRAQHVVVTVQQAVKQDMPDQMSNYTLHQMILGVIQAIQDLEIRLWKNAKDDLEDRTARQMESDRHRRSVRMWLLLVGIGIAMVLVLLVYLIGR